MKFYDHIDLQNLELQNSVLNVPLIKESLSAVAALNSLSTENGDLYLGTGTGKTKILDALDISINTDLSVDSGLLTTRAVILGALDALSTSVFDVLDALVLTIENDYVPRVANTNQLSGSFLLASNTEFRAQHSGTSNGYSSYTAAALILEHYASTTNRSRLTLGSTSFELLLATATASARINAPNLLGFNIEGTSAGFTGISYAADYSANYTARSLIDRGFADGRYAQYVASGNILYVSPSATNAAGTSIASDSWTRTQALGRQDRPFLTIQAAYNVATSSDVIWCLSNVTTLTVGATATTIILQNCTLTTLNTTSARVTVYGIGNANITTVSSSVSFAYGGYGSFYNVNIATLNIGSQFRYDDQNWIFENCNVSAGTFSAARYIIKNCTFLADIASNGYVNACTITNSTIKNIVGGSIYNISIICTNVIFTQNFNVTFTEGNNYTRIVSMQYCKFTTGFTFSRGATELAASYCKVMYCEATTFSHNYSETKNVFANNVAKTSITGFLEINCTINPDLIL